MSEIMKKQYRDIDHGTFDEEWGCHEESTEWWYATGYFTDEEGKMYSYQYAMNRVRMPGMHPTVIMLALTDFSTSKHIYFQDKMLSDDNIIITNDKVEFADVAKIKREDSYMSFEGNHAKFTLKLKLDFGKGAVWHCDNGVLKMGTADTKETTTYYSYPNMPSTGILTFNEKEHKVTGKTWFDKQGGIFNVMNVKTHWEWFSLRFYDDEEMMLFTFPQNGYQDGTFIPKDSKASRLINYKIIPLSFLSVEGSKFSSSWSLSVPGLKEENYTIKPLMEGQMNQGYFEELAGIYNKEGKQVGLCFVELLPGVYTKNLNNSYLLKKID